MENDASNNCSIVGCIHCHRNVFTEPLPSTEWRDTIYRAIALQTHRLIGGIYEGRRLDGMYEDESESKGNFEITTLVPLMENKCTCYFSA
jgi:hypothetical protein